jgi:metal-responsive CopG/Arc/MetJ family transcriptional regulator
MRKKDGGRITIRLDAETMAMLDEMAPGHKDGYVYPRRSEVIRRAIRQLYKDTY